MVKCESCFGRAVRLLPSAKARGGSYGTGACLEHFPHASSHGVHAELAVGRRGTRSDGDRTQPDRHLTSHTDATHGRMRIRMRNCRATRKELEYAGCIWCGIAVSRRFCTAGFVVVSDLRRLSSILISGCPPTAGGARAASVVSRPRSHRFRFEVALRRPMATATLLYRAISPLSFSDAISIRKNNGYCNR